AIWDPHAPLLIAAAPMALLAALFIAIQALRASNPTSRSHRSALGVWLRTAMVFLVSAILLDTLVLVSTSGTWNESSQTAIHHAPRLLGITWCDQNLAVIVPLLTACVAVAVFVRHKHEK